ncbi:MAG: CHAT domain-containing protein [Terriglobia bacterium]
MRAERRPHFVFGVFEDSGKLEKALDQVRIHVPTRSTPLILAGEERKKGVIDMAGRVKKKTNPEMYRGKRKFFSGGKYQLDAIGKAMATTDACGVPLPPDRILVGFRSPRVGQIGNLLRKYGAVEVHVGSAEHFCQAAREAGSIGPVLAGIVGVVSTRGGYQQPVSWRLAGARGFGFVDMPEGNQGFVIQRAQEPVFLVEPPNEAYAPPEQEGPGGGGGGEPPQPPGGNGGDGDPGRPVERFLEGRFPRRVRFGEKCYLEVRISVQAPARAHASPIKRGVLPDGKTANVLLLLQAPDFQILNGGRDRTIAVPPSGNSEFAMWELQAEQTGVCHLSVTAYHAGVPLGELAFQATVDAGIQTGRSEEQSSTAYFRKTSGGEITLVIHYEEAQRLYRYDFISAAGGYTPDLRSEPLKSTPEAAIGTLIEELNVVAKGKAKMDGRATREWLRGKGAELWTEFIPEKLQHRFWEERTNIKKIRVLSSGDPVPWELLYPAAPGEAPDENTGFLGEAFTLTRWRFGEPADPRLHNGPVCFVLPNTAPPEAIAEVDHLKGIVGGNSKTARNLAELGEVLKSGEFGILHFACHNLFELKQFGSRISMPDGPFEPSTLINYKNKFHRPFVFMNACRTDGVAPSYTRLTGWADKFLDTGAGAFVGSLWEVRDKSAAQFAATFYDKLLNKELVSKTLSEAMKAARESIGNIGGDPTWLAYSTYGDAEASIART